ncbi:MAG: hypothetical protein ACI9HK_004752, partial [Pirellulaceae bacterium]
TQFRAFPSWTVFGKVCFRTANRLHFIVASLVQGRLPSGSTRTPSRLEDIEASSSSRDPQPKIEKRWLTISGRRWDVASTLLCLLLRPIQPRELLFQDSINTNTGWLRIERNGLDCKKPVYGPSSNKPLSASKTIFSLPQSTFYNYPLLRPFVQP